MKPERRRSGGLRVTPLGRNRTLPDLEGCRAVGVSGATARGAGTPVRCPALPMALSAKRVGPKRSPDGKRGSTNAGPIAPSRTDIPWWI